MADFIIIKYKIEMPIPGFGVCWRWAKVTAQGRSAVIKNIQRSEANKLIEEYRLSLMHQDRNGKVWDTGEFKQRYGGYLKNFEL